MNVRPGFVMLSMILCGCAPVLQSTMSPTAEAQIPVDRVLIKGFEYKQHYVVGRDNSITPSVGVGYSFGKIANAVWHGISAGLGLSTTTTEREGYGDIGTLRTAMKNYIEDADIAKGVMTPEERQQFAPASVATTVVVDGKSGNEAVQAVTPWYWSAWNVVDYVTLLAFLGVPTYFERDAQVSLGVYNDRYERIGKYTGYARVSKGCYVMPGETLTEATLRYAYQDAVNKAAADWGTVRQALTGQAR